MPLRDSEARKKIVSVLDKNLFVEAGAGSGKTTSLVNRILAAVLQGARLENMVAITFTKEGAANLKVKLRELLESLVGKESFTTPEGVTFTIGTQQNNYLKRALAVFSLAKVTTIHSFCLDLLKERPVEAGLDPSGQFDTDTSLNDVFNDFWAEYIAKMDDKNVLHAYLMQGIITFSDIKEFFEIAAQYPELTVKKNTEAKGYHPDYDKIKKQLTELLDLARKIFDVVSGMKATGDKTKRINRLNALLVLLNQLIQNKTEEIVKFDLRLNTNDFDVAAINDDVKSYNEFLDIMISPLAEMLHALIAEEAESFCEQFVVYKKRHSLIGYDDMLFFARQLLMNPEVREYYKQKYTHFFIDETQDTDPLQTEIVFFLCEKPDSFSGEWKRVELLPGKLFMVGDPKQSIYGFRRADIGIYEEAKKIVVAQGGELIRLTTNFRSDGRHIDFINKHFQQSFSDFAVEITEGLQAEFIPLDKPDTIKMGSIPAVYLLKNRPKENHSFNKELELRYIPVFIKYLVEGGAGSPQNDTEPPFHYRDIMVLFRTTTHLEEYLDSFERSGVPFIERESDLFFGDILVVSAINALEAMNDFSNTAALYGALKSPLFGFSDDDILQYKKVRKRLTLAASINTEKSEEHTPGRLEQALLFLKELSYERDCIRLSGVLRRLYDYTAVPLAVYHEANGSQKTGKHLRLLEYLLDIEKDQQLSIPEVLRALKEKSSDDKSSFAGFSTDAQPDAVRIMTIHKAKGLEAKVVIIADGNYLPRDRSGEAKYITDNISKQISILFRKRFGLIGIDYDTFKAQYKKRENCEGERLRYVALTRACQCLFIALPGDGKGNLFYKSFQNLHGDEFTFEGRQLVDEEFIMKMQNETAPRQGKAEVGYYLPPADAELPSAPERNNFRSIHDILNIDRSLFEREVEADRGLNYGKLLHEVMEAYLSRKEFTIARIKKLADELELDDEQVELLLKEYDKLKKHSRVIEALNSPERHCEWEYFLKTESGLVTGVIDLVYKRNDGWVIVDFKTDDMSDEQYAGKVEPVYKKQIAYYAEHFAAITGEPVVAQEIIYSQRL